MMVHSLLESSEDVSSRLANLEERLASSAAPATENAELQSVVESLSLTGGVPSLNTYQQSAIEAQEISTVASEAASETDSELDPRVQRILQESRVYSRTLHRRSVSTSSSSYRSGDHSTAASEAASETDSELDPRVQRILQESRVYSRTLHRLSISTNPWSCKSGGGWSMLSGISLAQISNISVLSIPILASEVWGADHYVDPSVPPSFRGYRTLVSRRLRTQKLSEIIPHRSVGISQGFRRLISPRREMELLIRSSSEKSKIPKLLLLGKRIDHRDLL